MRKKHLILFLVAILLYAGISIVTPVDPKVLATYHLSLVEDKVIVLTFLVPIIATWYVAVYGFAVFKGYSRKIAKDSDGEGLDYIANGLGVLTGGLIASSLVSVVIKYLTVKNHELVPAGVIITNYLSVLITIGSYFLMYTGARKLVSLVKQSMPRSKVYLIVALYILFAVGYSYAALHNPYKRVAPSDIGRGAYYLPDWLIFTTVILPYIAAWLLGLLAALYLAHYRRHVSGIIYRDVMRYLGIGIGMVITTSILEQILALFTGYFQKASLAAILIIVYLLLAVIASGFLIIAKGAKRLKKLEGL